jgi:hypothetical protein
MIAQRDFRWLDYESGKIKYFKKGDAFDLKTDRQLAIDLGYIAEKKTKQRDELIEK